MAASFGFDEFLALKTQLAIPEAVKDRQGHATVAGAALDYRLRMDLQTSTLSRLWPREDSTSLLRIPVPFTEGSTSTRCWNRP